MKSTPLTVERRERLAAARVPTSIIELRGAEGTVRLQVPDRRTLVGRTELTAEERAADGVRFLRGHAAVFGRESYDLGGFVEVVNPGAFKRVLNRADLGTKALWGHSDLHVLGSISGRTLDLREDPRGLHYYVELPNTTYAADAWEVVNRGDVNQSSFAFSVDRDRWEQLDDGRVKRTIISVEDLFDVSPVAFPAYPQTDVSARDLAVDETEDASPEVVEPELENLAGSDPTEAEAAEARRALHVEQVERNKRRLSLAIHT